MCLCRDLCTGFINGCRNGTGGLNVYMLECRVRWAENVQNTLRQLCRETKPPWFAGETENCCRHLRRVVSWKVWFHVFLFSLFCGVCACVCGNNRNSRTFQHVFHIQLIAFPGITRHRRRHTVDLTHQMQQCTFVIFFHVHLAGPIHNISLLSSLLFWKAPFENTTGNVFKLLSDASAASRSRC